MTHPSLWRGLYTDSEDGTGGLAVAPRLIAITEPSRNRLARAQLGPAVGSAATVIGLRGPFSIPLFFPLSTLFAQLNPARTSGPTTRMTHYLITFRSNDSFEDRCRERDQAFGFLLRVTVSATLTLNAQALDTANFITEQRELTDENIMRLRNECTAVLSVTRQPVA